MNRVFTLIFDSKENISIPFYITVKLYCISANVRVNSYIYNMKLSSMIEHSAILSFISCTYMHLIFTLDIIVRVSVPGLYIDLLVNKKIVSFNK